MKSKDQRVPILLTCGLIILDMNAGNGLTISLSVYLSLSKNMLKTKQNNTKQKAKRPRKKKKNFPPWVVEPQTYDVKGQRDIHRAKATLNVKQKLYT